MLRQTVSSTNFDCESSQDRPPATEDVEDMEADVIESPPPSQRSYPRGRGGRGGRGAGAESRKFSSK